MAIDDFGLAYLQLALRIGKLIPDYIDHYFGPQEIQANVNIEALKSPKKLLSDCLDLQKQLEMQHYTKSRYKYIKKIISAMETTLRIQCGEKISYLEQVNKLFDISPELQDDSDVQSILKQFEEIQQADKNYERNEQNFKEKGIIPPEKIISLSTQAFNMLRDRTLKLFPKLLPNQEEIFITSVHEKPWPAACWYLGNYQSRIEYNLDYGRPWGVILKTAAHEGYPGHHTESVIKDKLLYQDQNLFEHSIHIIQSPVAVVSEAIAVKAIDVLYTTKERLQVQTEYFCPDPSVEGYSYETKMKFHHLVEQLTKIYEFNLAIYTNEEQWTDHQLVDFAAQFKVSKENLLRELKFLRHPVYSSYKFNYIYGKNLLEEKYGLHPNPEDFRDLLMNPYLPSDLEL